VTELNLVLAAQPQNDRARYFLGAIYTETKEDEKAISELSRIQPTSDYFADARLYLSYIYQRQGKLDEAVAEAEQALTIKKDDLELLGFLASLQREKGSRTRAIEILQQMVTLAPENDQYHFTLGAVYDELKDKPNCVLHMQKAIELNERNAAALNYLGYTWAEQGVKLDEAESLIRRALAIDPNEGFYIDSLGWVYYQRGDYPKAVEHLERAAELVSDDPTVIEHLGDAYEKVGRNKDASQAYTDALQHAKETEQIQRLRTKIDTLTGNHKTTEKGI
jgi:tetratricopeptide (TPR) repeat protein